MNIDATTVAQLNHAQQQTQQMAAFRNTIAVSTYAAIMGHEYEMAKIAGMKKADPLGINSGEPMEVKLEIDCGMPFRISQQAASAYVSMCQQAVKENAN